MSVVLYAEDSPMQAAFQLTSASTLEKYPKLSSEVEWRGGRTLDQPRRGKEKGNERDWAV